jgi:hypothetical protein
MFYKDPYTSTGVIINTIAMSNLFAAANNPKILEKLDAKTKENLFTILASYTDICVNNIVASTETDVKAIKSKANDKYGGIKYR